MNDIASVLQRVVKDLYQVDEVITLSRPDEQFGDVASNIALQLAAKAGKNPREIATEIQTALLADAASGITSVDIAGPGFLNFRLADKQLVQQADNVSSYRPTTYAQQSIIAEYSDPNPFKALHAGHLYTTIVGDSIARLIEAGGGTVHRANFGGDVGLHVARNMWAIIQTIGGEDKDITAVVSGDVHERAAWLSARYVEGTTAYEENEQAKQEIIAINKRVYVIHSENDHDSGFAKIYWTCREWSYEYFKLFYDELRVVPFEIYYPESQTTPLGIETVKKQLAAGVYEESEGAVVFRGEPYGLHTRVFINKEGLPTYEAKDVGLIMCKWRDYAFDKSIIITGNDIVEYMKVVLKSIEQFEPELVARTVHLTHGNLKMAGAVKMSSRRGNVLLALDILSAVREASEAAHGQQDEEIALGAIKYAFLKVKVGGNLIYDPQESVSLQGNSGPYLMYAHARARSILGKVQATPVVPEDLEADERLLTKKIGEYQDVLALSVQELMPHHVCTYLYELAQEFNRFYEKNRVAGDAREAQRLWLVGQYADVLKDGLLLLGIHAPERM